MTKSWTSRPNCKINLGLHVVARRPDGYHNLETIFVPAAICDELELAVSEHFEFHQDGIQIEGDREQNLCVKAYRLMAARYGEKFPLKMRLNKRIPFGAGLGGGSSDAAHVILMLNEIWGIGLKTEEMVPLAAQLGADCPFFLYNRPCYATGIGDVLEPLSHPIRIPHLVIVKPDISVATADAYRGIIPHESTEDLRLAVQEPIERWRGSIGNDFEATVFEKHPMLADLKEALYRMGAKYASMSGSGSAMFAIFDRAADKPDGEFENCLWFNVEHPTD